MTSSGGILIERQGKNSGVEVKKPHVYLQNQIRKPVVLLAYFPTLEIIVACNSYGQQGTPNSIGGIGRHRNVQRGLFLFSLFLGGICLPKSRRMS